jgi:DNA-binding CsgD family transcriptional regulator
VEAERATRARDLRQPVPDDVAVRADDIVSLAVGLPARTPPSQAYRALVAAERARLGTGPDVAAWAAAADACRESGEPYLLSYSLVRLAADALTVGERETGTAALREATEIAGRIGAVPLVEEAEALARRARVPLTREPVESDEPSPEPVDPLAHFGLTAREREILGLVASGLSNGQIAVELFISPKTASVHVSRILAKLGVAGRVEAAAVVHRLGLLSADGTRAGR